MSGVIDERGQQWEHCNACTNFVRIQDLLYEQPSEKFEHGRDICPTCWDLPEWIRNIRRAQAEEKAVNEQALYEETVFPTVCGHGAKPRDQVYRFVAIGPNSSRGYSYCSEKCAEEGGK